MATGTGKIGPWQHKSGIRLIEVRISDVLLYQFLTCLCLTAQDALKVVHRLMQQVDNSIALSLLGSCPISLGLDGIVRRDLFFVYTTQAKKHVQEMMVLLHRNHVVFARPKREKANDVIVYEFANSMQVRSWNSCNA